MTDKEEGGGLVGVGVGGFNSFIISWDKRSLFLRLWNRKVGCILRNILKQLKMRLFFILVPLGMFHLMLPQQSQLTLISY